MGLFGGSWVTGELCDFVMMLGDAVELLGEVSEEGVVGVCEGMLLAEIE